MPHRAHLVVKVTKWPKQDALAHARVLYPGGDPWVLADAIATTKTHLDAVIGAAAAVRFVAALRAAGGRAEVAGARRVTVTSWGTRGEPGSCLELVTDDVAQIDAALKQPRWTSPWVRPDDARACRRHIVARCGGKATVGPGDARAVQRVRARIAARTKER